MTQHELKPLVSVIVPTFNRGNIITETIQSVIAQTYPHWELLVVDDGSEDSTQAIVNGITDKRIRYFRLEHTGYIGRVRNHGIQNSTGSLIAFLDSDDLWIPAKLETQIDLLNKNPNACYVLSNGYQFGEGAIQTPDYGELFVGNLLLQILEHERFCFYSPTLLFKKDVLEEIGLLDETVPTTRDIEFFFRMASRFPGIFTNEKLAGIRKHKGNTSEKFNITSYYNSLNTLKSLLREQYISRKTFSNVASRYHYKMGLLALVYEIPGQALKEFANCIRIRPGYVKAYVRAVQSAFLTATTPSRPDGK